MLKLQITPSSPRLRFHKLYESDYETYYISKKFNNGDWDYWLMLRVMELEEYSKEFEDKYGAEVLAVSPTAAGEDNLAKALETIGIESEEEIAALKDVYKCQALAEYGVSAMLHQEYGSNKAKLLKLCSQHAKGAEMMFGFYMDAPQNAIGSTGWDFISGNVLGGLERYIAGVAEEELHKAGPKVFADRILYRQWSARVGGTERRGRREVHTGKAHLELMVKLQGRI